ncbi:MAG: hypothetical protein EXS49_01970 [Candidatus Pacebacteria bacterium]|nr:hypothetical protein [Candidatus Paceibacterota bacterium]
MISKLFNKLLKNKKFLLAAILFAGLFFVFGTKNVQACNWLKDGTACIEESITSAVQVITLLIFSFLGRAINIISNFLFPLVSLGNQALGSPLVRTGFRICLQVANLGFVVSIIYVAFATITKFNDYKIKDFLIKLITAAVLINFSFAMAGTIMDVSNVVGNYFLAKSIPDGNLDGFSEQMANAFNLGKITQVKPGPNVGLEDNLSSVGRTFLNIIFSMWISIFVSIIILLTFIGIAGMMLARYVAMVILLTCMPVIWLCYMSPFPQVKSYFGKWWEQFLKWIYFYPITAFFLYLALLTATTTTAGLSNSVDATNAAQETNRGILNAFGLTGIIDSIVKAVFFMVALYAGNKAGGGFMTTTFNLAKGTANKMIGAYKGAALGTGKYIGSRALKVASTPLKLIPKEYFKGANATGKAGILNRALSYIPGLGQLNEAITGGITGARKAGIIADQYKTGEEKKAETLKFAQERTKDMNFDKMKPEKAMKEFSKLGQEEKMAVAMQLNEGGKADILGPELVKLLAKTGKADWVKAGAEKQLGEIENKNGINQAMAKASVSGEKEAFSTAMKEFHEKISKKDRNIQNLTDSAMAQEYDAKNPLHTALGEVGARDYIKSLRNASMKNNPGAYVAKAIKNLPDTTIESLNKFKLNLLNSSNLKGIPNNVGKLDNSSLDELSEVLESLGFISKEQSRNREYLGLDEENNYTLKRQPIDKEELLDKYHDFIANSKDPKKCARVEAFMMKKLAEEDTNVHKVLNKGLNTRLTGAIGRSEDGEPNDKKPDSGQEKKGEKDDVKK